MLRTHQTKVPQLVNELVTAGQDLTLLPPTRYLNIEAMNEDISELIEILERKHRGVISATSRVKNLLFPKLKGDTEINTLVSDIIEDALTAADYPL